MSAPLFSVVVPTYNRPDGLIHTIGDILGQTWADWELIVVDDSDLIQLDLVKKYGDKRIRYFHRGGRLGVSSARNFGALHANGEYLAFIDDDDGVSATWLAEFSDLINKNDFPDVLFCAIERVGSGPIKNRITAPDRTLWALVIPGAFILSKRLFDSIGGYDERLSFGENTELFFRIRAVNPKQAFTNSVNFFYNQSAEGLSQNLENKIAANKIYLEKHAQLFASNKRLKFICLSVIGVSLLRIERFDEARGYLLRAYKLKPFHFRSFFRVVISYFPAFSKKNYSR